MGQIESNVDKVGEKSTHKALDLPKRKAKKVVVPDPDPPKRKPKKKKTATKKPA